MAVGRDIFEIDLNTAPIKVVYNGSDDCASKELPHIFSSEIPERPDSTIC
jgi:hypothetical protein